MVQKSKQLCQFILQEMSAIWKKSMNLQKNIPLVRIKSTWLKMQHTVFPHWQKTVMREHSEMQAFFRFMLQKQLLLPKVEWSVLEMKCWQRGWHQCGFTEWTERHGIATRPQKHLGNMISLLPDINLIFLMFLRLLDVVNLTELSYFMKSEKQSLKNIIRLFLLLIL